MLLSVLTQVTPFSEVDLCSGQQSTSFVKCATPTSEKVMDGQQGFSHASLNLRAERVKLRAATAGHFLARRTSLLGEGGLGDAPPEKFEI